MDEKPIFCDLTTGVCGEANDSKNKVFKLVDLTPPAPNIKPSRVKLSNDTDPKSAQKEPELTSD